LAGFHFHQPSPDVPELLHHGEYWAMPEWFIGDHADAGWEFYFQESGESEWAGPAETYRLTPGSFLAVGPGVRHRMNKRALAKHHFYYVAVDMNIVWQRRPALRPIWHGRQIVMQPRAGSLATPFRQLTREVTLAQAHRAEGLRLALDTLVLEASRVLTNPSTGSSLVGAHPAVAQVKELLDHQCQRPWRLADLARVSGVSPTHLAELFTRDVGMPPRRYLLQVRIERAQQELAQRVVPITTLALELGFSSSQHFATTFRRLTGQSPREYARPGSRPNTALGSTL